MTIEYLYCHEVAGDAHDERVSVNVRHQQVLRELIQRHRIVPGLESMANPGQVVSQFWA